MGEMGPPPAKRLKEHVELAFLGPRGTYGEQAARAFAARFHTPVDLVPCSTITAVYDSPSPHIVLPLENTLQGGVQETLDCLLSSLNPQTSKPGAIQRQIKLTLSLPIRHCLVALKGTQLSEITYVRSHEQALGQSARYLDDKLPRAKRERWSSTAGAAVSLLESPEGGEGKGAAICSKAVLGLYPDALEVLHEGTQYGDRNYTRFLLLSPPSSPLPKIIPNPRFLSDADRNHIYAIPSANLTGFLSSVGLPAFSSEGMGQGRSVKMIHTRPAAEGWTAGESEKREDFPRWHLVEIDGELADDDRMNGDDPDAEGEGEGGVYKLLGIVHDEISHMELKKLL